MVRKKNKIQIYMRIYTICISGTIKESLNSLYNFHGFSPKHMWLFPYSFSDSNKIKKIKKTKKSSFCEKKNKTEEEKS